MSHKQKPPVRSGIIVVKAAIVIVVMMGMVALSVDLGLIAYTKTQLQAAADSAALGGGTELKPGLGADPIAPGTVVTNATGVAVDYASMNPNGGLSESYADGERDVDFGWAVFNTGTDLWEKHFGEQLPSVGGYNMIRVVLHRDQPGSTDGDRPVSLFFASVLGRLTSNTAVKATAVIMPAKGFRVIPGSEETANVMPFALREGLWKKYLVAQAYVEENGIPNPVFDDPVDGDSNGDGMTGPFYDVTTNQVSTDTTDEPLFGHMVTKVEGKKTVTTFVQDFADGWECGCDSDDPTSSPSNVDGDGILEVNLYPKDDYTSGNFGTVDIGSNDNAETDIERQILHGPNEGDMSNYTSNQLTFPSDLQGDTGLSAGFKDALDTIAGQCRTVLLFSTVTNPGNNATFHIVALAGIRIMYSELTGSMEYKSLLVQRCDATLHGAVGAIDQQIGEDTTVFTPLILIE